MIFHYVRKTLIPFILLSYITLSILPAQSEDSGLTGLNLSQKTFTLLENKGFHPTKKDLGPTGNDQFPFNISVGFNPDFTKNESSDYSYNTLIFISTQKDLERFTDQFVDLINFARSFRKSCRIEFAFTVENNSQYDFSFRNYSYTGLVNYASNLDYSDDAAAVILSFSQSDKNSAGIYTTGYKKSSPLWLTRNIIESFVESKTDFVMMQKFLSMYRAGFVFGDQQMAALFFNDIPAIKVELGSEDQISIIKNVISNFEKGSNDIQDIHYAFFKTPFHKVIWITEKANIISLEVFGMITIFLLAGFSFSGKKRIRYKKEFSRTWFMLPLTLFVSMISLYAGQLICRNISFISSANPVTQLGIKFITSALFVSIFFGLQQHFTKMNVVFVYGYLLNLVSISNIFIFSILDISLFWIFAFEYLIIYNTREAKNIPSLVISSLGILIPFIPYLGIVIINGSNFDIMRLISSTFGVNLLLALIIYPFQTMWLRILNRLLHNINLRSLSDIAELNVIRNLSPKKVFSTVGISTGVILVLFVVSIFIAGQFRYSKNGSQGIIPQIQQVSAENLSMAYKKSEFDNMSTAILTVKSKRPAFRYEITVHCQNTLPVLDSFYDYKVQNDGKTVTFSLPDNPPEEINIEFVTENLTDKEIKISALYSTGNPALFYQETVTGIRQ